METAPEEARATTEHGVLRALAHRSFALVFMGTLVSNVGNWIEIVCQNWLVYDKTDSPEHSGLLQFLVQVPGVFLALPMGLVADRVDRRRLFLWFQVLLTLVAAVQAAAAHLGYTEPWRVMLIAFLENLPAAAMVPIWGSLLPDLVPRRDLSSAIALSSAQFNIARVAGPVLAGWLYVSFGSAVAFDVNVASFALVILALALATARPRDPVPPRAWRQELGEAARLVWGHGGLRRTIATGSLFLTLAAPQIPLLAALAKQHLKGDVSAYSRLVSCMGLGAVTGAFLMGVIARHMARRRVLAVGSAFVGATFVLVSWVPWAWAPYVCVFGFGLGWCVTLTAQNTALQLLLPDRIRGRVMSLNYFAMMVPSTLAHLAAGAAAERSLEWTLTALGACLALVAVWNVLSPEPLVDGAPIELPAPVEPAVAALAPVADSARRLG